MKEESYGPLCHICDNEIAEDEPMALHKQHPVHLICLAAREDEQEQEQKALDE